MLQSLPNEEQNVSLMNHLGRLPFFFLGMWAHLGRFFLDQDWLYSFTQKSEYPISLMQPGIHRRKTKSADCSPDRAGTWATSLALPSDMNERQKKNCMPMIWYQLLWRLLQFYLLLQGMDSRVTDPFPGMTVADLLLQGWRTPCYHEGRVHLIAVPARFACALPICCCGSSGLDVHMSPFAANWLNLPFSLWSLHNWWMNVK